MPPLLTFLGFFFQVKCGILFQGQMFSQLLEKPGPRGNPQISPAPPLNNLELPTRQSSNVHDPSGCRGLPFLWHLAGEGGTRHRVYLPCMDTEAWAALMCLRDLTVKASQVWVLPAACQGRCSAWALASLAALCQSPQSPLVLPDRGYEASEHTAHQVRLL